MLRHRCRRSRCLVLSVLLYVVILPGLIIHLLHENSTLKAKVATLVQDDPRTNDSLSQAKPTRKWAARKFNQSSLTFVLYQEAGSNERGEFYKRRLQDLGRQFPSSPSINILRNVKNRSLGASLNLMLANVKTEYFLILEPSATLSDRPKEGIAYLWNALEQYPELDFVGGSYMSTENKLRVACYRFRLCQWTLSESYEYERSLDNVMICDSVSTSFMGRTDSVRKLGGFDVKLSELFVVKDFFLRAKTRTDVVVGTRPNVVFLTDNFTELYQIWKPGKITKELAQFAVKHKVFKMKDANGNVIDICSATSPLSGKDVCIEKNSHKLMLNGGHWAYNGLFTYPYLLKYLEITLSEISDFFNRRNVSYAVEGGVALGAIKMRSILPWEAGDIDMGVYEMTLDKLYTLLQPLAKEKGYVVKKHGSESVHVFCTPKNVGSLSGGLATIFPHARMSPPLVKVETNGIWVSYSRDLVHGLLREYGKSYLQHKMYASRETVNCKMKDHNACLPNFKSLLQGRAGNLKEYFCQI